MGVTVLQKIAPIPRCQREHTASHIHQGCMLFQLTRQASWSDGGDSSAEDCPNSYLSAWAHSQCISWRDMQPGLMGWQFCRWCMDAWASHKGQSNYHWHWTAKCARRTAKSMACIKDYLFSLWALVSCFCGHTWVHRHTNWDWKLISWLKVTDPVAGPFYRNENVGHLHQEEFELVFNHWRYLLILYVF